MKRCLLPERLATVVYYDQRSLIPLKIVRAGGILSREPPISSASEIRSLQEELTWPSGSNNMSDSDASLPTLLLYTDPEHTSRIGGCVTDDVG